MILVTKKEESIAQIDSSKIINKKQLIDSEAFLITDKKGNTIAICEQVNESIEVYLFSDKDILLRDEGQITKVQDLSELDEVKIAWLLKDTKLTVKQAFQELKNDTVKIILGSKKENTYSKLKDIFGENNLDDLKLYLGETSFDGFVEFLFKQRGLFQNYIDFKYDNKNYTIILCDITVI